MKTTVESIIETLTSNGYDAHYAGKSETDYGTSEYVTVWKDNACQKIRISDHSVENRDRLLGEIHLPINIDGEAAAKICLHEIRLRFDFDKFFEKRDVTEESFIEIETPTPYQSDEIISSRPRVGKKNRPSQYTTVYTVRRKKIEKVSRVFSKESGKQL